MYTLHFQDSQVARVSAEGADLHILLSSAAVSVAGDAVDSGSGYLAPVLIVLQQANWQGNLGLGMGRLSQGELQLITTDGAPRQRILPLPCELDASVQLSLDFANGTVLHITAKSLRIVLDGKERYTESYAC